MLTQLRSLPVDQMRLDRSFAAALDDGNDKQAAVVRSVVSPADGVRRRLELLRSGGPVRGSPRIVSDLNQKVEFNGYFDVTVE